jgi:hypothetical protein
VNFIAIWKGLVIQCVLGLGNFEIQKSETLTQEIMIEQKNENQNPQHEDGSNQESSNQRTNQERGGYDLNPTDRDENGTDGEFEEKEGKLEVTSKTTDPSEENEDEENPEIQLPPNEDPNVNAENENQREKTGTMRNLPQ